MCVFVSISKLQLFLILFKEKRDRERIDLDIAIKCARLFSSFPLDPRFLFELLLHAQILQQSRQTHAHTRTTTKCKALHLARKSQYQNDPIVQNFNISTSTIFLFCVSACLCLRSLFIPSPLHNTHGRFCTQFPFFFFFLLFFCCCHNAMHMHCTKPYSPAFKKIYILYTSSLHNVFGLWSGIEFELVNPISQYTSIIDTDIFIPDTNTTTQKHAPSNCPRFKSPSPTTTTKGYCADKLV